MKSAIIHLNFRFTNFNFAFFYPNQISTLAFKYCVSIIHGGPPRKGEQWPIITMATRQCHKIFLESWEE
jgi:hypothetical protein